MITSTMKKLMRFSLLSTLVCKSTYECNIIVLNLINYSNLNCIQQNSPQKKESRSVLWSVSMQNNAHILMRRVRYHHLNHGLKIMHFVQLIRITPAPVTPNESYYFWQPTDVKLVWQLVEKDTFFLLMRQSEIFHLKVMKAAQKHWLNN